MREYIQDRLVVAYQLESGWTPTLILTDHYGRLARVSKTASERGVYIEARDAIALFGKFDEFVKSLALKTGVALKDVIRLFKDSRVVKLFSKVGWSFEKLWDMLREGWKLYGDLLDAVRDFALTADIKSRGVLTKLDEFLKTHPKTKRITGVGVGLLMLFLWWQQAYTGDTKYDFDASEVLNGLSGHYSLADMFSGEWGQKLLLTLAMGSAGMSFPWPGKTGGQFALSMLKTLAEAIGKKLSKSSREEQKELEEDVSLRGFEFA